MPVQRIKDLRPIITTLDQADQIMAEIARLECDIAVAEARAEKKIAAIKSATELATAEPRALGASLKTALAQFIETHRELFEKPRKRKTSMGSYGLQSVTELIIDNQESLINEICERGYEDCLKIVRTPVKTRLVERIQDGETFPGCAVFSGDTAVCKVAKTIVEHACQEVE